MERFLTVAGGQLGPIARNESRQQVVSRLLELMHEAKARGSDIVVFPELALTTFFPRWWMDDEAELDSFFERSAPTKPVFARSLDGLKAGIVYVSPLVFFKDACVSAHPRGKLFVFQLTDIFLRQGTESPARQLHMVR